MQEMICKKISSLPTTSPKLVARFLKEHPRCLKNGPEAVSQEPLDAEHVHPVGGVELP